MNLIINNSSMEPIYEQIIRQIKEQIMNGKLLEQSALPSIRSLANHLKISALTVKKAYDSLEADGFILTVHGKGSFVAPGNHNLFEEEQRKEVERKLEEAAIAGRSCGMTDDEIKQALCLILDEI